MAVSTRGEKESCRRYDITPRVSNHTPCSLHQSVQIIELFDEVVNLCLRYVRFPCYTNERMKKAVGRSRTTDNKDVITEELQIASRMTDARQLFIAGTLNLSWRLALSVLIPLIGGIQLDKKFNSEPTYTLLGLVLAFILGSVTVWATVKEVNELQSSGQKQENKEK